MHFQKKSETKLYIVLKQYRALIFYFLLVVIIAISSPFAVAQKSRAQLEKEKKENLRKINLLNNMLSGVQTKKSVTLGELNTIQEKIRLKKRTIDNLNEELAMVQKELDKIIYTKSDLENDLMVIKKEYAALVYAASKVTAVDKVLFLFASRTFYQFRMRLKYLTQYAEVRKEQVEQMKKVQKQLIEQEEKLLAAKAQKEIILQEQLAENEELKKLKDQQSQIVAQLNKQEKSLKKEIEEKQKANEKLERLIEDLIRKEMRKIANKPTKGSVDDRITLTPEAAIISSSFAENKSRLIWPVSAGFIASRFGKHEHPVLKNIIVDNLGVDIQTNQGEKIRSVFDGEVGFVAQVPGMPGKIVSIRHGEYFTVYSNLKEVFVSTGDKIKLKQVIGEVLTDKDGNALLQFQVWRNSQRLNPQEWLASE